MNSIRNIFGTAIAVMALCLLILLLAVWRMNAAASDSSAAEARRTLSLQLADELRQSSDDLTRLARTYVVTGDPKWEEQYFTVRDIRNGKKPRPPGYEKIYWDFLAAGQQPSHAGAATTKPLLEMMKDAGFTEAEFAKLKEAAANSDDLVKTETVAMNLVKGLRADDKGQFVLKGEPDRARATAMMHDLAYHQYKAKIMKPVDEFLAMLDERTRLEVAAANQRTRSWFWHWPSRRWAWRRWRWRCSPGSCAGSTRGSGPSLPWSCRSSTGSRTDSSTSRCWPGRSGRAA